MVGWHLQHCLYQVSKMGISTVRLFQIKLKEIFNPGPIYMYIGIDLAENSLSGVGNTHRTVSPWCRP